ncbi:hypothetical protein O3P69_001961 [Scylla paramamosain]|uniref:Uncharacterized protein n=1 Tax=Scylla paramamosain TaxID=85552 RepID=A0AAW0V0Z3_SCYPA
MTGMKEGTGGRRRPYHSPPPPTAGVFARLAGSQQPPPTCTYRRLAFTNPSTQRSFSGEWRGLSGVTVLCDQTDMQTILIRHYEVEKPHY